MCVYIYIYTHTCESYILILAARRAELPASCAGEAGERPGELSLPGERGGCLSFVGTPSHEEMLSASISLTLSPPLSLSPQFAISNLYGNRCTVRFDDTYGMM